MKNIVIENDKIQVRVTLTNGELKVESMGPRTESFFRHEHIIDKMIQEIYELDARAQLDGRLAP